MSLIPCTESECIDKILTDYNQKVTSRKDYYLWANEKYQKLIKLKNQDNFGLVQKAFNFVTYLDSVSIADRELENEENWDGLSEGNRYDIKKSLIEEFDPEGKERKSIKQQLVEMERKKRGESEKNAL